MAVSPAGGRRGAPRRGARRYMQAIPTRGGARKGPARTAAVCAHPAVDSAAWNKRGPRLYGLRDPGNCGGLPPLPPSRPDIAPTRLGFATHIPKCMAICTAGACCNRTRVRFRLERPEKPAAASGPGGGAPPHPSYRRTPAGYCACHTPTRPLRPFWLIIMVLVDHAEINVKHALYMFLVLSGRGVTWRDLPAP